MAQDLIETVLEEYEGYCFQPSVFIECRCADQIEGHDPWKRSEQRRYTKKGK